MSTQFQDTLKDSIDKLNIIAAKKELSLKQRPLLPF